ALDTNGTLWFDTVDGELFRLPKGASTPESSKDKPFLTRIVDHHGHAWDISVNQRLDRAFNYMSSGHAQSLPFVSIFEDREQNLWLGSEGHGMFRLQPQLVKVVSKADGLADENIYPIYQDKSGAIWLGAWNVGLSRIQSGSVTN